MPELAVQQKLGPYLLLREVGHGGMALVFEALDERTQETVAVKLLKSPLLAPQHRAEMLAHLDREVNTLTRLSHPNIVTLHQNHIPRADAGDDLHYIALEYLNGTNLRVRMGQGRLSPDTILFVLEQVAEGLDALHAAGYVYGDLKPSNIMQTRDGDVKLIDFGMSRLKQARSKSTAQPLAGSPAYLAPERLRSHPVSAEADLWAMGVLLYEMLTGSLPFPGSTVNAVLNKILHESPVPLPLTLAPLDLVLQRALAKDAKRRYPSARALVTAYAAAAGLRCRWTDQDLVPSRPKPRLRWAAAGGGLLLAVGMVAAAAQYYAHPPAPPSMAAMPLLPAIPDLGPTQSLPVHVRVADSRQEQRFRTKTTSSHRLAFDPRQFGAKAQHVESRQKAYERSEVARAVPAVPSLPALLPMPVASLYKTRRSARPVQVAEAFTDRPSPLTDYSFPRPPLTPAPPTVQIVPQQRVRVAPAYEVIALGPLGDDVQGLNDQGQSVGGLGGFAVLWQDGTLQRLDGPVGRTDITPYSEAAAINDHGQVAGFSHFHAFLWHDGQMTDLGTLSGRQSNATALNDLGQVVGTSHGHAVWWHDGQITDLGTLGGDESHARAINDRGQIVGVSYTPNGYYHAFLWQDGQMRDLGTLGGPSSLAVALNDKGQVAGLSVTATGATHAFLWQNGRMTDLGSLTGDSQAFGLDQHGEVVGSSGSHATLWRGGTITDLNTLIGPDTGLVLRRAVAINTHGQILCYGQRRGSGALQAVLLTHSASST